ncbi:uncharacterized protein LOC119597999 [Penaeus monodon]|uniref:uncharacterized protein LOC119597999 n=1 Tax=Penaeus monodon TaxID=6687 RepID=UPI0018A773EA|nr:uncharacterized protein LOC119597999 [Penaeus monodon]
MPRLDQMIDELSGTQWFLPRAKSAYWTIEVEPSDRPKTDSKNPLHQSVWHRMREEDLSLTAQDGMDRVYSENYAFMLWGIYFRVNYAQDCRVFTLPTGYFPTYTSFALTKGSPLVPVFNKLVLDIISSGLLKKWWQELSITSTDCNALETQPIELKTVLTPFLLLIGSILVSLGALLVERVTANVFQGGWIEVVISRKMEQEPDIIKSRVIPEGALTFLHEGGETTDDPPPPTVRPL